MNVVLDCCVLWFHSILDESVELEIKNFSKTLHEEVFSKKVGVNPPLLLQPEEVPIISEMVDDQMDQKKNSKPNNYSNPSSSPQKKQHSRGAQVLGSDDEVQPVNYLFSSDP